MNPCPAAICCALLSAAAGPVAAAPALLPLPAETTWTDGAFPLTADTVLAAGTGTAAEAERLLDELRARTGLPVATGAPGPGAIELRLDGRASHNDEGYRIWVNPQRVRIAARAPAGLFYGTRTFLQLLEESSNGWTVPGGTIADAPRFRWRGLMLDEARHFMGKEYVLHLLDTMAAHKLNTLHWHLTDDQGWRVEIKAYPRLTEVGAWRGEGTEMPVPDWDINRPGHPGTARYGGFYTQDDIREIVAHAADLHIQVLPEVDVPGHSSALATAYPETLPTPDGDPGKSINGLRGDVISVVREENYQMLEEIFAELSGLFPATFLHVGGDEVNVNAWQASPEHRAFMAEQGMTDPRQLQNHFMLRLEKILAGLGRTLVGWNEILLGGQLSRTTVVMSWTGVGPGIEAARIGHPVIMCPAPHCYLDMRYPGPGERGNSWAGAIDTRKAYEWNPSVANQLNETEQRRILGVQGNLWAEYMPNPTDADYKLWPRACAIAEVAWTPQENREWAAFDERLGAHLARLDRLNVGYRVRPPTGVIRNGAVTIVPPYPGSKIVYTTDGSEPTGESAVYAGEPLRVPNLAQLQYRTVGGRGRLSPVASGADPVPVAAWRPEMVSTEYQPVRFDLGGGIGAAGVWRLAFLYRGGAHKIVVRDVKLLRNEEVIAQDTHEGHAGSQHVDNTYRLPVPAHQDGDRYAVIAELRSDGGTDSQGILTLEFAQ